MKISINGAEIAFSDQPQLNKQLLDSSIDFKSKGNPSSSLALPFVAAVDTEQGSRRLSGYQESLILTYKPDEREAGYRIGDYSRHLRRYPIFGGFEGIFSAVVGALINAARAANWLLPVVYTVGAVNLRAAVAEIRVLSNPTEGEFLVIGKQRFIYKASAPIEDDEILIGADESATASNIAATISARPLSLAEAAASGSTVTATANTPGLPLLVFSSTADVEAETLIEASIGGTGGSPQAVTSAPVQFTAQGEYLDAALSAVSARLGVKFRINPATGKLHIFQPGLSAAQTVSVADLLADCAPSNKRIESLSYRTTGPRATRTVALGRNGELAKEGQLPSYFETIAYDIEAGSPRTGYGYSETVDSVIAVRFTAAGCEYLIIITITGDGTPASTGDGGDAADAQISNPRDVAVGPDGTIYFTELVSGSPNMGKIRKIDAATNEISTFYTDPDDGEIESLAVDSAGNVYAFSDYQDEFFTDFIHLVKITPAGTPSDVISAKEAGFSGDGADAIDAATQVNLRGLACDSNDDLILADNNNHRIRKITFSDGKIDTIVGTGAAGFSGDDGDAASAQLDSPNDVCFDAAGNLYIADSENHRIRRVDAATNVITTFAGNGTQGSAGNGGDAVDAELDEPLYVAHNAGIIYISSTDHTIRQVSIETGIIDAFVGDTVAGFTGDGGPPADARIDSNNGIAVGPDGSIYIVDTGNQRIRKCPC